MKIFRPPYHLLYNTSIVYYDILIFKNFDKLEQQLTQEKIILFELELRNNKKLLLYDYF